MARTGLEVEETNVEDWYNWFSFNWSQGQHVVLMGPTGSGKTSLASILLEARTYVIALAVKRNDDTLEKFKKKQYKVVKKWPPEYGYERIILWIKPKSLDDIYDQAITIHYALQKIYLAGGWTVFFDDAGYITGYLGLGRDLGVMLNQGRSSYLSIVVGLTQPKSVVARVPSETFKQCTHQIVFKYSNVGEIKAISDIVGIDWHEMVQLLDQLDDHDFLYIGKGHILLVRNRLVKGW